MPTVRLIEKSEIPRTRRHGGNERAVKEREEARKMLLAARDTGKAVELTLDAEEREDTVKFRYRLVAKDAGLKMRFNTAQRRPVRTRCGKEAQEAEVLYMTVR